MSIIKNIKVKKNDTVQNIPIYSSRSEIDSAQAVNMLIGGGSGWSRIVDLGDPTASMLRLKYNGNIMACGLEPITSEQARSIDMTEQAKSGWLKNLLDERKEFPAHDYRRYLSGFLFNVNQNNAYPQSAMIDINRIQDLSRIREPSNYDLLVNPFRLDTNNKTMFICAAYCSSTDEIALLFKPIKNETSKTDMFIDSTMAIIAFPMTAMPRIFIDNAENNSLRKILDRGIPMLGAFISNFHFMYNNDFNEKIKKSPYTSNEEMIYCGKNYPDKDLGINNLRVFYEYPRSVGEMRGNELYKSKTSVHKVYEIVGFKTINMAKQFFEDKKAYTENYRKYLQKFTLHPQFSKSSIIFFEETKP